MNYDEIKRELKEYEEDEDLVQMAERMIDFLKVVQPDLDVKPGTVARDILTATTVGYKDMLDRMQKLEREMILRQTLLGSGCEIR